MKSRSAPRRTTQKQYRFEVDQSVRVEELNRDTVIGIGSGNKQFALVLPRKVKRHFNEHFRRIGRPRQCAPLIFVSAAIITMKRSGYRIGSLVVDREYENYSELIIAWLSRFFSEANVIIKQIGKNSPGHAAAYLTHIGRRKADGVIKQNEITQILKTAGESHHLEFTRIHKSNRPVKKKYSWRKR